MVILIDINLSKGEIYMIIANIKLITKTLLIFALVCTLSFSSTNIYLGSTHTAWAASEYKSVDVVVNGKEIRLDQNAILKNGSTLIPLRGVFSELGAELDFNPETQEVKVQHPNAIIMLTIGSKVAYINGIEITLTQPAELLNGRTLVPLRFISESIGATVHWKPSTSTATIIFSMSSLSTNTIEGQPSIETTVDINTLYGGKTYGTKSQSEYDKVMEIVNKTLEEAKEKSWFTKNIKTNDSVEIITEPDSPFKGFKSIDRDYYENTIRMLIDSGVGLKESMDAYNILYGTTLIISMSSEDYSAILANHSAYDGLVLGIRDCGSYSHAINAVFDAAGYNTAIMANSTHADPYVKIGDNWFSAIGGVFKLKGSTLSVSDDYYIYTAPTYK